MSLFKGMALPDLEQTRRVLVAAIGPDSDAGRIIRDNLEELSLQTRDSDRLSPDIVSNPKHGEVQLRNQGRRELIADLVQDELLGLAADLDREISERKADLEKQGLERRERRK